MASKLFFINVCVLLVISIFISILLGPVNIGFSEIGAIVLDKLNFHFVYKEPIYTKIQETVLLGIRLPRVFLAILVGTALAASGAILQGLFRNPLVDPGFIGVSSGAAIGAMFVIMFSNLFTDAIFKSFFSYILPVFAMLGSVITTYTVYKISKSSNKTNVMTMLLSGIAINALIGSLIGLLVISSNDQQLRTFTFWTLGGLDSANWEIVFISSLFILAPIYYAYNLRTKLDIFMLGDSEAESLGLPVENLKRSIVLISALMVGVSVAFCGMIGFIGLVTPHLVRLFIGPNHRTLLIGSALLGSLILVVSDLISRTIIAPAQLPIGIITSIIGAPFFIWLIIEQKNKLKIA